MGILLPEDGPPDYEWYELDESSAFRKGNLPLIEVGKVMSDGHHEPAALLALGATDRLSRVAEPLVRDGAQALVWACTSGSFIGGLEWAKAQANELEKDLGVPVTSTALAFHDALSALGYRHVDILSPYPEDVTKQLVGFLYESNVLVENVKALDCTYAADSHQLDIVEEVRAFCAEHGSSGNPLLIPDTAINTLELVETMNRQAGRGVLTANQVSLWAGLKLMKWPRQPATYLNCLAGSSR
ncbi:maleate cis-trans isomerase [Litchfieldella qijiaojingensis]|uniref:Maleate cis-trans isomerase n=1 Tax=Litchfieldella qijiaojingensis TaxID=980347 RepID=A0ABQ2YQE0_9GAMM|nr:maleate cis-trans isomerase [Halomonas qijiaojingensis]